MTVVLVHGAPETSAVWEPLVSELATVDDYPNWAHTGRP
jgi:pimeloyl-ACP methyl ester carboxylesterase